MGLARSGPVRAVREIGSWALLAGTAVIALPPHAPAAAQAASQLVEDARANVVRVEAGGRLGFGFLVGFYRGDLLVATAWHTLDGPGGTEPEICFFHAPDVCSQGTVVHVADRVGAEPALDLVLLTVAAPEGLAWRPGVLAPSPSPGDAVWFIGRNREWYIPPDAGRLGETDEPRRLVGYTGLPVARGVSGGPILTADGIVAMHVQSEGVGDAAWGVGIDAIRVRVEDHLRGHWILQPSDACSGRSSGRLSVQGRRATVYVDATRPAAAIEAMIRLRCAGARVLPVAVADGGWPGNRIAYGRGELRLVRAVQGILAPMGRLDTELDLEQSGVAVWLR